MFSMAFFWLQYGCSSDLVELSSSSSEYQFGRLIISCQEAWNHREPGHNFGDAAVAALIPDRADNNPNALEVTK
jgi:hypothetical protein